MGARGKKRVRANGQVASCKLTSLPRPDFVPPVRSEDIHAGLETLRASLAAAGNPSPDAPAWQNGYRAAAAELGSKFGPAGEAVIWRTTFLDALLGWDAFTQRHEAAGDLPSKAMLHVAGTIPTHGAETSFDLELFEEMLLEVEAA